MEFNGQNLFADENSAGGDAFFGGANQKAEHANLISIHTSSEGSDGTKVLINRSLLLSALTVSDTDGAAAFVDDSTKFTWADVKTHDNDATNGTVHSDNYITFAKEDANNLLSLENVSAEAIEGAIENLVFLRAQAGAGMSRLQFSADSIATQETNMRSALGRIEDVDIAMETANLAKYSILMQASAAMVAQANVSNDVALMLLR